MDRIAEKARVAESTVRAHFARNEDFPNTVWHSVVEERKPYTLANFYARHKRMLKRVNGGRNFIHLMLIYYSAFFRSPKTEYFRCLIRIFFIENIGLGKSPRKRVNEYFQAELNAFHNICHDICGITDTSETALWYLFIMHPLAIAFSHLVNPEHRAADIPMAEYEHTVMEYAEQQLLFRLGLLKPEEHTLRKNELKPEESPLRKTSRKKTRKQSGNR